MRIQGSLRDLRKEVGMKRHWTRIVKRQMISLMRQIVKRQMIFASVITDLIPQNRNLYISILLTNAIGVKKGITVRVCLFMMGLSYGR